MKHTKIKLSGLFIVLLVILVCAAAGAVIYFLCFWQHTSTKRLADRYTADVTEIAGLSDADGDGIPDQEDILQGALAYIETAPKYKSAYYEGGYPDDGYGVCTDVVAAALGNAGYDLMTLVDEDIAANPEDYEVDEPDPHIDFRRVRNLKVYFAHTAQELTTDLSEIDSWQGGDIVIFTGHIGIVSDRRNENGVPYVIHHNSPSQSSYEEDILEKRTDLVAHYRIGAWMELIEEE